MSDELQATQIPSFPETPEETTTQMPPVPATAMLEPSSFAGELSPDGRYPWGPELYATLPGDALVELRQRYADELAAVDEEIWRRKFDALWVGRVYDEGNPDPVGTPAPTLPAVTEPESTATIDPTPPADQNDRNPTEDAAAAAPDRPEPDAVPTDSGGPGDQPDSAAPEPDSGTEEADPEPKPGPKVPVRKRPARKPARSRATANKPAAKPKPKRQPDGPSGG